MSELIRGLPRLSPYRCFPGTKRRTAAPSTAFAAPLAVAMQHGNGGAAGERGVGVKCYACSFRLIRVSF